MAKCIGIYNIIDMIWGCIIDNAVDSDGPVMQL